MTHSAHPSSRRSRSQPPNISSLKIVSYNVRYFGHATRGLLTTSTNISKIARTLATLQPIPDVICLQEVETNSLRASTANRRWHADETQLDRLMTELHAALGEMKMPDRYAGYYFPAHTYRLTGKTNIYTTGLAIVARESIEIDTHNAHQPKDITHRQRAKNLKQTRICAHASLKLGQQRLDIFNTHLSLPSVFSKEFWTLDYRMGYGPNQLEEARTLVNFVHQTRQSDHYVVLGDFNSLPGSPVDRFITQEGNLIDAFAAHKGMTSTEARKWPTAGFMNLRMHLDHVYSSHKIDWIDFHGTHPFGHSGTFHGLSDHVPYVGRFQIQSRKKSVPPRGRE